MADADQAPQPINPRTAARELAFQILFLWDAQKHMDKPLAEVVAVHFSDVVAARQLALTLSTGAWMHLADIDTKLEFHAPQWPPKRQAAADRNILRLAAYEMLYEDTPKKVVIDEAIELAKKYSTEESGAFVNGVLDAIYKEIAALTGESAISGGL